MKKLLIIVLLCTGCNTGMFLRYNYPKALVSLPPCSKVHTINNDYITFSLVETSTNNVHTTHTNYYRAYYNIDGKITKTLSVTNAR